MPSLAFDAVWINGSVGTDNFREHGARVIVAAGVIEDPDELARHAAAVGASRMLHVRLVLDPEAAAARLRVRHGDDAGLDWHLRRHPELASILDRAGFRDELVIDTTALTPDEVAATIAARVFPHAGRRP